MGTEDSDTVEGAIEVYTDDDPIVATPAELMAMISKWAGEVPDQYRDTTRITISGERDWDVGAYPRVMVTYRRPMTEQEIAERERFRQIEAKREIERLRRRAVDAQAEALRARDALRKLGVEEG